MSSPTRLAAAALAFLFVPAAAPCPSLWGLPSLRLGAADDDLEFLKAALSRRVLDDGQADQWIRAAIRARIPALDISGDRGEWEARARRARESVLREVVLAGVPTSIVEAQPNVEEAGAIERGQGYRIRKLRYECYPGLWIPALIYEPYPLPGPGRLAAVLHPHGHVGALGKAIAYEQVRSINLAKRGIIVLKPDWFAFGELSRGRYGHNEIAHLDLCGVSGVSLFYLALKRGLDVLLAQPAADPNRVAVSGLSGGGWQTIVISALDERVKAMAPNAGYSGLELRLEHAGSIGDLEQNPTDLVAAADYPLLTAAFAPRPALLIYNRNDDCCFPAREALDSVYVPVAPLYARWHPLSEFSYHINVEPGTHNYDLDNRRAFYRFLDRLGYPAAPLLDEIPSDGEVLPPEQLNVGLPPGNRDFRSIALELARELPRDGWPAAGEPAGSGSPKAAAWRAAKTARLREVLRLRPSEIAGADAAWSEERSGVRVRAHRVRFAGGALAPVLEIEGPAGPQALPILVFADGGRTALPARTLELLARGSRVFLADLALHGENRPRGFAAWQGAMMLATVGERPLGLQVSQALALGAWVRERTASPRLILLGEGRSAGCVALAAAALDPAVESAAAAGVPASLKLLIEDWTAFSEAPALFCFGLLETCDVRELVAMIAPRRVSVLDPIGAEDRVKAELGHLENMVRTW